MDSQLRQRVAPRSSNLDLILYATLFPLVAISLAYFVYGSSNTPFFNTISNHSIYSALSPIKLKPIIVYSLKTLLPWAVTVGVAQISNLFGSCVSILKQVNINILVYAIQWAWDKLSSCEIACLISVFITWLSTTYFNLTYLRFFISIYALVITNVAWFYPPKQCTTVRASKRQFRQQIRAMSSVFFSVIDYNTLTLGSLSTVIDRTYKCHKPEDCMDCGPCWGFGGVAFGVALTIISIVSTVVIVSAGLQNVTESWRFVAVAREKEAASAGVHGDMMKRVVSLMTRNGWFTEEEREEEMKEEALQEIVRMYEVDDMLMGNVKHRRRLMRNDL